MPEIKKSDSEEILEILANTDDGAINELLQSGSSRIAHNVEVAQKSLSPKTAQAFNLLYSDIVGAGETFAHVANKLGIPNADKLKNTLYEKRKDIAENLLYNPSGETLTNFGTETLRTLGLGIGAGVGTLALRASPFAAGSILAGLAIRTGAVNLSKALAKKMLSKATIETAKKTTQDVVKEIGKLGENKVAKTITHPTTSLSTTETAVNTGNIVTNENYLDETGKVYTPEMTNTDIALGAALGIVPTAAIFGAVKGISKVNDVASNRFLIQKLKKAKTAKFNNQAPITLNKDIINKKYYEEYKQYVNTNGAKDTSFTEFLIDKDYMNEFGFLKTKKPIDKIVKSKNISDGAFIDANNNILIKNKDMGLLVGKLKDEHIIIDTEKSKLKHVNFKIDGKPILEPFEEGKAFINESEPIDSKKSHYHEFKFKDGKIEERESSSGLKQENLDLEEILGKDNISKDTERGILGHAIVNAHKIEDDNIELFLEHPNNEIKKVGKALKTIKTIDKIINDDKGRGKVLKSLFSHLKSPEITNKVIKELNQQKFKNKDEFEKFINTITEPRQGGSKSKYDEKGKLDLTNVKFKNDFINALMNSAKLKLAETVLKHEGKELTKSEIKKLSSSIVNTAFDSIGFKEATIKPAEQKVRQAFVKAFDNVINKKEEDIDIPVIYQNIKQNEEGLQTEPRYQINKNYQSLIQELKDNDITYEDLRIINESTKFKNLNLIIEDEHIKSNIPLNKRIKSALHISVFDDSTVDMAKKMANVEFEITKENIEELTNIIKKYKDASNEEIAKFLEKEIKYKKVNGKSYLNDELADTVKDFKKQLMMLEDFLNDYRVGSSIKFNVKIIGTDRVMYDSPLSPHASKLFKFYITPKNMKAFSKSEPTRIELFKRWIVDEFGDADLSKIKTTKELEKAFIETSNKLKKIKNPSFLEDIGKKYIDRYENNDEFKAFIEIDGKNNGYGNIRASLGLIDSGTGIGSDWNKEKEIYNEFKKKFKEITGIEISRKASKSAILPKQYGSSFYGATEGMVDYIIREEPETLIKILDDYLPNEILQSKFDETWKDIKELKNQFKIAVDNYRKNNKQIDKAKNLKNIINEIKKELKKHQDKEIDGIKIYDLVETWSNLLRDEENKVFKDFSEKEFNNLRKYVLKKLQPKVEEALKETFPIEVNEYFDLFESVNNILALSFKKSMKEKVPDVKNLKEEIKVRNSDIINEKQLDNVTFKINDTYEDILNKLIKNNVIKPEDSAALFFVKERIPYMYNAFGDKVYFVKLDSIGYDKNYGLRFQTIGTNDLMFVIHNISLDASIAKNIAKQGQLNIFDAIGGGSDILETARVYNKQEGLIFRDFNPFYNLSDALQSFADGNDLFNYAKEIAYLRLVKKGKPSEKAIKREAQKIIDTIKKPLEITRKDDDLTSVLNKLKEKLKSKYDEIKARKEKLSDDLVFDQFTLGGDLTKQIIKDLPKEKLKYKKINRTNKTIISSFNEGQLKAVIVPDRVTGDNKKLFHTFKDTTDVEIVKTDTELKFDTTSKESFFDDATNTIVINRNDKSPETLVRILHEATHKVVQHKKAKYAELNQWFRENFPEETFKINTERVANTEDEALSIIIGNLLHNEVLFTNKELFAKSFAGSDDKFIDLDKFLRTTENSDTMKFLSQKEGFENIKTTRDLLNYLKENVKSDSIEQQLTELVRDVTSLLNSNTKFVSWLNGFKEKEVVNVVEGTPSKFVNKVVDRILNDRAKMKDSVHEISTLNIFEVFQMDAQKENLEKAVSIANGIQNKIDNATAEMKQILEKEIDDMSKKFGDDVNTKVLGNSIMLGFNILREYGLDKHLNFTKSDELLNSIVEIYSKELNKFSKNKILSTLSEKEQKQFIDSILLVGSKLAKGEINEGQSIIKRMNKIIRTNLNRFKLTENISSQEIYELEQEVAKIIKIKAIKERANIFKSSLERITSFVNEDTINQYFEKLDLFNRFKNDDTLFGENIYLNNYEHQNRLKMVRVKNPADLDREYHSRVATLVQEGKNGKKQYYAVVTQDFLDQKIGKQDSQILDFDLKNYEKGIWSVYGKGKKYKKNQLFINGQNVRTANKFVDHSYTRMFLRNYYIKQKQDVLGQGLFEQFNILKKGGLLLTKEEYEKIPLEDREHFDRLPKNNPISRMFGVHYYNKKYAHYLLGTKGVNTYKMFYNITQSKQIAKLLSNSLKLLVDAIKILKNTILVSRVSSYINSFVSSWVLAINHGVDFDSIRKSRKLFNEYKALVRNAVKKSFYNEKEAEALWKKVEEHPLHNAFMHGIASTIRTDAYHLGVFETNEVYNFAEKVVGSNGATIIKYLALDPSTKIGHKLGTVFDETEIIPKAALYLSKQKELGSEEAVNYVLMAFPTYNNLNPVLNTIDQFVPFTKYFVNVPKMLQFALEKNFKKTLAMQFAMYALPYATYAEGNSKQDEWFKEHGFAKVGSESYYYVNSLNPLNLLDFGERMVDPTEGNFLNLMRIMHSAYDVYPIVHR